MLLVMESDLRRSPKQRGAASCVLEGEMADTDKITRQEMIGMFGTDMPAEAINLMWDSPDTKTLGELRAELRQIARAAHAGTADANGVPRAE